MTSVTVPDPTEVVLEVLYLDAQTCDPCRATTDAVAEAAAALAGHLRGRGRTLTVRRTHVTDREQAEELGFVSSPTVRVDGHDIELDVQEQLCGSCSALAGERVDCRTFEWRGERYPSPPAEMIETRVREYLDAALPEPAAPSTGTATGVARFLAARATRTGPGSAVGRGVARPGHRARVRDGTSGPVRRGRGTGTVPAPRHAPA